MSSMLTGSGPLQAVMSTNRVVLTADLCPGHQHTNQEKPVRAVLLFPSLF